jgi:hypothetical protein
MVLTDPARYTAARHAAFARSVLALLRRADG